MRQKTLSLVLANALGLAALTGVPVGLPVLAQEAAPTTSAAETVDSGAYLAANTAFADNDFRQAAGWFSRALIEDSSNAALIEKLAISELALGEVHSAAIAAERAQELAGPSHLPHLAILADRAQTGDFAAILADPGPDHPVGGLIVGLATAWAHIGQGSMSDALAALDKVKAVQGFESFALYHKGLALAAVGDMEGAEAILSGDKAGPLQLPARGVIAHVQILSQLERSADALKVLKDTFGDTPDPGIAAIRRQLEAGAPLPFDIARTPAEGIAEAFFSVAVGLNGQTEDAYVLLFARTAAALRPDNTDALMLSAELMERLSQPNLAQEIYGLVPADDPAALMAGIGRAEAMLAAGEPDQAVVVLQELVAANKDQPSAKFALGDMLRRLDRCAESIPHYDDALTHFPDPKTPGWQIYFNRGSCHERTGNFDGLVKDMRLALEINPNQPQVLNYLGYSYVDRGENLDEAMAMIEKAVAAEPEAGYIVDSLAWALYRLGRIDEALPHMERASLLEPVDPIVTDHLGDVYWVIGRQREAVFQWKRALSYKPTDKDAIRMRRKLEIGLDAVLAEEAAAPAKPVVNGN
jgi:tetratricopeptide (TPR) repeat protein